MIALLLIASQVARVVVYPDRAQVTRVQEAPCNGKPVIFTALPPSADPSSLRALTSEGGVEAVDLQEEPRVEAYAAEAQKLDQEIRKLQAAQRALQDARERAQNKSKLAQNLDDSAVNLISTEFAQPAPDTKAWRAAFDQTTQARLLATKERTEIAARERELQRQLGELYRKQQQLGESRQRRERRAEVLVGCLAGRTARVELTYLVGGASWTPAYEARADESGSHVALSLYATVQQSTGEPWEQARLSLSTAVPSQDATPPELAALRVYADPREPPKKVLVRRDELQKHADQGAAARGEAQGMQAEEQGLSVQLAVKGPADVPGDGTPSRLFVSTAQLPASYAWRSVPKQLPFVFRVADLDNTAPFPLLAGPVDLFRKGAYLGSYSMERQAEGARFHFSFGLEEGMKIKRTAVEEIARDKGIFKSSQRFHYVYKISIENHLGRVETLELKEPIPVSELGDVSVEVEDSTTPGFEKNAEDGILTWKLKLGAGEKKELTVAFHVDVPKDYATGL